MESESTSTSMRTIQSTFGPVELTSDEHFLFTTLFTLYDTDIDGMLHLDDCMGLWRRCGISDDALRLIF